MHDLTTDWQPGRRRVVVTGFGVVAPNGIDIDTFWRSVVEGRSSIRHVTRFDAARIPAKCAAEITSFEPGNYMDGKKARRFERSTQYAVAAARMALDHSRLDMSRINPRRIGVVEGSSMSNMESILKNKDLYQSRGYRSMLPSVIINAYVGTGSGEIASELGLKASAMTASSTSASGNDVVGYATDLIRRGVVHAMLAGGSEAPLVEEVFAGFYMSKAMARRTDNPAGVMRPFDSSRDGFVLGEGSGFLVLEELAHALQRDATIYAEVLGHGRACEAFHPLAPEPGGEGVVQAMHEAFLDARILPGSIDYINAHGSSTQAGDLAETRAIKRFFGSHARRIAVSATKPVTGHGMAAAGAFETIICCLALHHQIIPMTLNHQTPGEECDLDYVPGVSRPYPLKVAANLNSGFGGKNSCLLLRRYGGENGCH